MNFPVAHQPPHGIPTSPVLMMFGHQNPDGTVSVWMSRDLTEVRLQPIYVIPDYGHTDHFGSKGLKDSYCEKIEFDGSMREVTVATAATFGEAVQTVSAAWAADDARRSGPKTGQAGLPQ